MEPQECSISQSQNQVDQPFKETEDARHYDDMTEPNFVPRSIYKQAMSSTRFDDPFIEIMYSAKPKRYNSNKFKKIYNDDHLSDKNLNDDTATPVQSKDQIKEKYDDKYYTKIYRNPILNKREKFVVKPRKEEAESKDLKEKVHSNELQSSYNVEFNDKIKLVQPEPILNLDFNSNPNSNPNPNSNSNNDCDSHFSRRNLIPIYKAPIIPSPSETNADLRKKAFYTTSYRKSFDNNVVLNDGVNKQSPKPVPISLAVDKSLITLQTYNSKFRPLCGNLNETIVRGSYNKRIESNDTSPASNWNNKMKSIIFPYKN